MSSLPCVVLLGLAVVSRADTDARPLEGELSLRLIPGMEAAARMTPHRIIGPTVSLVRQGDSFDGQIGRSAASLKLSGEGLHGYAREGQVALYAERKGDTVVVRGTYGAGTSRYPMAPTRPLHGRIEFGPLEVHIQGGDCALELERERANEIFRGGGFCGNTYRQAELFIDERLWSLLKVEPEVIGLMVLESTLALD